MNAMRMVIDIENENELGSLFVRFKPDCPGFDFFKVINKTPRDREKNMMQTERT